MEKLNKRFALSKDKELQFRLIADIFSVNPEELPIILQLGVIELQYSIKVNIKKAVCKTFIKVWTTKSI